MSDGFHIVLVHEPGKSPELFGLSRRVIDPATGHHSGPWRLLTEEEASELADTYNADPGPAHGGTAHVVEVFRYENDPAWPEELT